MQYVKWTNFSYILKLFRLIQKSILPISIAILLNLISPIQIYADSQSQIGNMGSAAEKTANSDSNLIGDIISEIASLTCETETAFNFLRGGLTHTCIKSYLFNMAIANILSPGLYAMTMIKLRLDDDELFGDQGCNHLTLYEEPEISFAFCSDFKLIFIRPVILVMEVVGAAVESVVNGKNFWDTLQEQVHVPARLFHDVYWRQPVGAEGVAVDFVSIIPYIPWQITQVKDTICVSTYSFVGLLAVGCKFIAEPFSTSVSQQFFAPTNELPNNELTKYINNHIIDLSSNIPSFSINTLACQGFGTCYQKTKDNTHFVLNITTPLVECVKEALVKLFVSKNVCSVAEATRKISSEYTQSTFYTFQKYMRRTVSALLTLYVIFFGFRVVMGQDGTSKAEITTFIMRFLLVTYFSIGIINPSDGQSYEGITRWLLPWIFNASSDLANLVLDAGNSTLCYFAPSRYDPQFAYLSLWDSLDCKLSHYLGIDTLIDHSPSKISYFSIPPYFLLVIPALYMGNLSIAMALLSYPILLIALTAYLVNTFVSGMLISSILGVLAPLFVPCALFAKTKPYFESWARLLLGFTIQPMVITIFMTTFFAIYEMGFFNQCIYSEHTTGNKSFFVLETNLNKYPSANQYKECTKSLGWFISANPAAPIKSVVALTPGLFTTSPKVQLTKLLDFINGILVALLLLYVMRTLAEQISGFVTDISGGIDLGGASLSAVYSAVSGVTEQLGANATKRFAELKEHVRGKRMQNNVQPPK